MARQSDYTVACNDLAIAKAAKAKAARQREWTIRGVPGLILVVKPSGTATWLVQYQVGKGTSRQRKRRVIGRHGVVSLADARAEALRIVAGASKGIDVLAVEAAEASTLSLRQLFAERRAQDNDTAPRTLDDYELALEKDVFPTLGNRPARDITAHEIARVLERVEDRARHAAHKARSALGSTYRWAQRRRLVDVNPCAGLAFTHQSERRKRVLTDDELARLWRATENCESVTLPVRRIIQLAILTGQRNSEVAGMENAELKSLDSATPRWDIPARRMKRKTDDQYVPLSTQAAAIVRDVLAEHGGDGVHVFPGTTHGRRVGNEWVSLHISQDAVSHAFARIVKEAGLKDVHLHDMRKCITSWLAEHGLATPEVLDAILHHGRRGVTGSHYNFALYEGQVRKALQAWADHVDDVVKGQGRKANVTKFTKQASA